MVTLFDVPHLLKCTRNALLKYDIEFTVGLGDEEPSKTYCAEWARIVEMFQLDRSQFERSVPKLTEAHLRPVGQKKMKVKYAAQVFSHAVTACISVHVSYGEDNFLFSFI